MSSHFNFKDNLTIDNDRYLKWYNSSNIRQDIIGLDVSNNMTINDGGGNVSINPGGSSHTFFNNGNTGLTIIDSSLGIGYSTTTNTNSKLTLAKNNFISVNSAFGSNDGYIAITGSSSLNSSSGSRFISYGQEHSTFPGSLSLYTGNSGDLSFYTALESRRAQILNNGTTNFTPNGSTIRLSIQDSISTFNNIVSITDTTQSSNATTGALIVAGGLGVLGNTTIDGTLSINSMVGNLEFNSTRPSTSYSSGSITVEGGIGIQSTSDVASVTSGGGLSVAGGFALGKSMIAGGNITVLSSTVSTNSQNGALVVYGGVGLNKTIFHKATAPHINYSPLTTGNESSIHFYTLNDFTESSGTSGGWHLGQNTLSIGTGNFTIGHYTNPRLSFHSDGRTVLTSNTGTQAVVAGLGLALSTTNTTIFAADTDISQSNRQLTVYNASTTNNTFAAISLQSNSGGTSDIKLVGNSTSTSRKLVTTIDNVDLITLMYTGTILGSNSSTVSLSTDSANNLLDIRGGTSSDSSGQLLLYGSTASSTGSVLIIGGNVGNGHVNILTNESGTLYSRVSVNRGGDISFSNTSGSLLDISHSSATFQNNIIIDNTTTTALLVRKDSSGGDVFSVDTTNSRINFVDTSFYATLSGVITSFQFDTNDNILYDRTDNQFRFTIGGTSTLENTASAVTIIQTTQIGNTVNVTGISDGALRVNGDILAPRIYTYSSSTSAPTFTTRSIGTRIILDSNMSASTVDYALGIESGSLWYSVPTTSNTFKWYTGTTQAMSLTGTILTLDTTQIIDITNSEALLVRKNGNSGNIFNVDTSSNIITAGSGVSILSQFGIRTNLDAGFRVLPNGTTGVLLQSHDFGNSGGTLRNIKIDGKGVSFYSGQTSSTSILEIVNNSADGSTDYLNFYSNTFFDGNQVIDNTSTEAFLIRRNSDSADVFTVDTTNLNVRIDGNLIIDATDYSPFLVRHNSSGSDVFKIDTVNDITTIDSQVIIDHSNVEAFLVRKDIDGGDIFNINTTNGIVSVLSTVASISTTTGSLQVVGGIGVQGSMYIGGSLVSTGDFQLSSITLSSTSPSTNLTTGSIVTLGGITTRNTSNATSLTNGGSLLSAGGASIAKDIYIGGNLDVTGTVNNLGAIQVLNNDSNISYLQIGSSRSNGSIQPLYITGWNKTPLVAEFNCTTPSISKSTGSFVIHSGGLAINHTSNSSSITAGGSLTVGGGGSFNKAVYIGTTLQIGDNTISTTSSLVISTEAYGANKNHGLRLSVNDASSTAHVNYRYIDFKLLSNGASTYRGALAGSLGGGIGSDFEFISLHQTGSIDFNGISNFLATANSSGLTSGSIISSGGLAIAKDTYLGGTTVVGNTVNSTSSIGGALNVSGDFVLGATNPRIHFPTNGLGVPTFTTRSVGTKLVLYPSINASNVDYSLGIASNILWSSVPTTTDEFRWYGGTTQLMSLTGSVLTLESTQIIDNTSTTALLVRKNSSGGDVFSVDTTNSRINFVDTSFYATLSGVIPSLQFDTNDNILYDRTANQFRFTIGGTSTLENTASAVTIIQTTQIGNTVNVTGISDGALRVNGDILAPRIYTYSSSTSAPTFTTRSIGTRIILDSNMSASTVDYALGIESGSLWYSVPTTSNTFKWYTGTTQAMSLNGTSLTLDTTQIIDVTNSEALLVRKNSDGGDIFNVDTSTEQITMFSKTAISLTSNSTSNTAGGALTISGGIAIAKDAYVGGTFYNSSDERLKTDITPIQGNVTDLLDTLTPMTYKHNKEILPDSSDDVLYGLVAQDVLKVFPCLVKQNGDGDSESFYNLDYTRLCVVLLKAIQELSQRIKILEK